MVMCSFPEILEDVSSVYEALSLPSDTRKFCSVTRYTNSFSTLFQKRHFLLEECDGHDLYQTLSIVFYGDELYRDRVKEMICSFESYEDHENMVASLLNCTDETKKTKTLTKHVTGIRSCTILPGCLEFFAAASIFNVPIFVEDVEVGYQSELYMPLTSAYGMIFEDAMVLRKTESSFELRSSSSEQCLCHQERPNVKGRFEILKYHIYEKEIARLGNTRLRKVAEV